MSLRNVAVAVERNMSTCAELLGAVDPAMRPIFDAIRATLNELHAGAVEIVWPRQRVASYGIGPRKLSDHYAFIAPLATHVKLGFYRGAFLNDPHKLLVGRGPRSRHIALNDVESARSEALKHLVRQSISERLAARSA